MSSTPSSCSSTLIVVPTLRERDNIVALHRELAALPFPCDLLVVDDASDDGTRDALQQLMADGAAVTVLARPARLGLGTAYTLALAYAAQCGYRHIVQMDADFSHDPQAIPRLVAAAQRSDVVIGSRYVSGGGAEGWSRRRWWLSRLANTLARCVVGHGVQDVTGGFRCTRGPFLQQLTLGELHSVGFSWQWEFNRLVLSSGGRITEVPICFHERAAGKSKLTLKIMIEGIARLMQMGFASRSGFGPRPTGVIRAHRAPTSKQTTGV